MWGTFQFGWHDGFGADADHLKTVDDLNAFIKAGYSFFTIDPGEYVDNSAETLSGKGLQAKLTATLWENPETTQMDLLSRLSGRSINFEEFSLTFSAEEIMRAVVKYGYVVAYTVKMYRSLCDQIEGQEFDLEISVDETDSSTTFAEHFYLVSELKRLGVKWVSLAPRFSGCFEKGVDCIGDLDSGNCGKRENRRYPGQLARPLAIHVFFHRDHDHLGIWGGDMHAAKNACPWGLLGCLLLSFQVILGYVILGALETHLGILFTGEAPAAKPTARGKADGG